MSGWIGKTNKITMRKSSDLLIIKFYHFIVELVEFSMFVGWLSIFCNHANTYRNTKNINFSVFKKNKQYDPLDESCKKKLVQNNSIL